MFKWVCSVIDQFSWSLMTPKYNKNKISGTRGDSRVCQFLPHVNVFRDQLLNKRTATWNIFVLYNREIKISVTDVIYTSALQIETKCENNLPYCKNNFDNM